MNELVSLEGRRGRGKFWKDRKRRRTMRKIRRGVPNLSTDQLMDIVTTFKLSGDDWNALAAEAELAGLSDGWKNFFSKAGSFVHGGIGKLLGVDKGKELQMQKLQMEQALKAQQAEAEARNKMLLIGGAGAIGLVTLILVMSRRSPGRR